MPRGKTIPPAETTQLDKPDPRCGVGVGVGAACPKRASGARLPRPPWASGLGCGRLAEPVRWPRAAGHGSARRHRRREAEGDRATRCRPRRAESWRRDAPSEDQEEPTGNEGRRKPPDRDHSGKGGALGVPGRQGPRGRGRQSGPKILLTSRAPSGSALSNTPAEAGQQPQPLPGVPGAGRWDRDREGGGTGGGKSSRNARTQLGFAGASLPSSRRAP